MDPWKTPFRLAAVLSFFVSVSLFSQVLVPIAVDPPDPTSTDPVTLIIQQFASCPPPPTVVRSGFNIDVTLSGGPCLFPPGLVTHRIELGTLAAGRYTVSLNNPGAPAPFTFDVLPVTPDLAVSQSVGSTSGGTPVIIAVSAAHCLGRPLTACPPPAITFGGVPATDVIVMDQAHFRATTPVHAVGAVQVVVNDVEWTKSSYAFRYYDPLAPPSAKFFERVLLPVVFNGPGAFGSNWVTELSLVNANGYSVEPWRPIAGLSAIAPSKAILFGSGDAPNGIFLVVPRQATPNLTFHAAVRDSSRADSEWATQIPVVREGQFSSNPVELLDLPIDPRFRTMLRIYSSANPLPEYARQVRVSVYSLADGHVLRDVYPELIDPSGCSDAASCAEHPSFASIADVTSGLPTGRVGIQIQGGYVPLWAFATVTNNTTQHVTVVSPQ